MKYEVCKKGKISTYTTVLQSVYMRNQFQSFRLRRLVVVAVVVVVVVVVVVAAAVVVVVVVIKYVQIKPG